MSSEATSAVARTKTGHPTAKLILLALSNYADPFGGTIYPRVERIAIDAEVSERTARRWMKYLRDHDFIQLVADAHRHRPNEYQISPRIMEGFRPGDTPLRGVNPAPLNDLGGTGGVTRGDRRGIQGGHSYDTPNINPIETSFKPETPPLVCPPKPKPIASHDVPPDFAPNDADKAQANTLEMSDAQFAMELASFKDYRYRKPIHDWHKAFRGWLRNWAKYREENETRTKGKRSTYDHDAQMRKQQQHWAKVKADGGEWKDGCWVPYESQMPTFVAD